MVFLNLLGSIGFMISALLSIVLPEPSRSIVVTSAIAFTLQGAICFLVGALLMLPETAIEAKEASNG